MGTVVYGGSFNPVHIAHMRLAIETLEALEHLADRLDFVPCASPPHKKASGLLPFGLRVAMIEASIANQPRMACNTLEAERSGPSYTWDTLLEYGRANCPDEIYFLVGSMDYELLAQWRNGIKFPELCHLVVATRGDFSLADFEARTRLFWPIAAEPQPGPGALWHVRLPGAQSVIYAPLPYLDISASAIRQLWLAGRSVEYLLPGAALRLLGKHRQDALASWGENR